MRLPPPSTRLCEARERRATWLFSSQMSVARCLTTDYCLLNYSCGTAPDSACSARATGFAFKPWHPGQQAPLSADMLLCAHKMESRQSLSNGEKYSTKPAQHKRGGAASRYFGLDHIWRQRQSFQRTWFCFDCTSCFEF